MLFFSLISSLALAVPQQLSQQGRLLEANGAAMEGIGGLTFKIFDAETGGSMLWDEVHIVDFINGYYAVTLGADSSNPLDDSLLAQYPLYLEITVNNNTSQGIIGAQNSTSSNRILSHRKNNVLKTCFNSTLGTIINTDH